MIITNKTWPVSYTHLTQKEYLADIERFVWAPTRAGKTLTDTEMRLQMNYLTKLIEGSVTGVAKNATRKGITDMYGIIEILSLIHI